MREDKRVLQSKEKIYVALASCMLTMEYEDIQLLDIAKKAGVSRQTIYRNYTHKDHILLERFDRFMHDFLEQHSEEVTDIQTWVTHFFTAVESNLDFFRLLSGAHLDIRMLERFEAVLSAMCTCAEDVSGYVNTISAQLEMKYHAGGLFQVYRGMLNEETRLEPGEMAGVFVQSFQKAMCRVVLKDTEYLTYRGTATE